MLLITYKAIAALFIFLISITTVIYPLKKKHTHVESLEWGEALASGIFLGVAFFHMLPNAIQTFQLLYPTTTYPIPEVICMGSFLLMLFLERLSFIPVFNQQYAVPYILALILIIHSLTEGAALGVGETLTETLIIFIAIIAHKGSASFALCVTLMRHRIPLSRIILTIFIFSLMTPIGIGFGTMINLETQSDHGMLIEAFFDAFAAGTFLYVSTLHHIRFHHEDSSHGLSQFACLSIGLFVMGLVAFVI